MKEASSASQLLSSSPRRMFLDKNLLLQKDLKSIEKIKERYKR
jgi:hypothetical protein